MLWGRFRSGGGGGGFAPQALNLEQNCHEEGGKHKSCFRPKRLKRESPSAGRLARLFSLVPSRK